MRDLVVGEPAGDELDDFALASRERERRGGRFSRGREIFTELEDR
jgi:hypothetical protein